MYIDSKMWITWWDVYDTIMKMIEEIQQNKKLQLLVSVSTSIDGQPCNIASQNGNIIEPCIFLFWK